MVQIARRPDQGRGKRGAEVNTGDIEIAKMVPFYTGRYGFAWEVGKPMRVIDYGPESGFPEDPKMTARIKAQEARKLSSSCPDTKGEAY